MTQPRLVSRIKAAAYCGLSPTAFSQWVDKGRLPRAVAGRKWDIEAIKIALDKMSGLDAANDNDPFEAWKRSQEGGK
ncbi:hypothetical protein E2A64_10090 [Pseudohoeflea suaedae]|uniref:DNA-binding protein n=1 Tax=Pseudohoeflea suaedae TaxID=877384 RepID=A0A4R5PJ53_9HYPH|nr:hypothetical protein [Pseudohoeflea suaedae]TDH35681.1 hypothetical protein E2A64_10090 [Pseudohoeflea suaedae]